MSLDKRDGVGSSSEFQLEPTAIPIVEDAVVEQTVYLSTIIVTNDAGSATTVTIKDNQETPKQFVSKPVSSNDILVLNFIKSIKFDGGLRCVASQVGAKISGSGYYTYVS